MFAMLVAHVSACRTLFRSLIQFVRFCSIRPAGKRAGCLFAQNLNSSRRLSIVLFLTQSTLLLQLISGKFNEKPVDGCGGAIG
jgi:hypothetical protein